MRARGGDLDQREQKGIGDTTDGPIRLEDLGHPRGTLVIVILFGLLFGLAWLGFYVFQFLGRGAPHS